MKKILFVLLLLALGSLVWGQEVLWTRYYSDMTEEECEQIIAKTISGCVVTQDNINIYAKKEDKDNKTPYIQLMKSSYGDYWFTIAGPYYTSILFIGRKGNKPIDEGFVSYLDYMILIADPKYAVLDVSRYFKKK